VAIALVASRLDQSSDTNGFTSGSINATGANLLTVVVITTTNTGGVVTDSSSNSWTEVASGLAFDDMKCSVWYAVNPTVTSSHTISVTGTGNRASIAFAAWSGADTSAPFDQTANAQDLFNGTIQAGSVTPTTNDQVVIAAMGATLDDGTPASIDGGFTIAQQADGTGNATGVYLAYLIQTTAAAANPTWTDGAIAKNALNATFKAAAGGGGGNTIAVPAGSLTMTGFAPTVATTANNVIAVPLATMTLTGNAPTVTATQNNLIEVPAGSLTMTGFAPSVQVGGNQSISVPLGTLTMTGLTPTVTATNHQTVAVPAGSLSLTGFAPTVIASANNVIAVPAGSLTINGFAPTVAVSDHNLIAVPLGTLTMTAIAPSVQASGPQVIDVPLGALTITVYAPTVINSTPNEQSTGGWWPDYEQIRRQRERRRREIEEAEAETQRLQDETDREIARLLREQEARDAERADLERLQRLADKYAGAALQELPKAARVAILNAQDARTRNSLEQMRRVIERELDDEMMLAVQQVLLMMDA
jgi:hypothetical protein